MADNQPRDEHAKALKQQTSQAKELRTRVLSDPGKMDELVDALNETTALRLVAHRWADAFGEAQEAVALADRLVASRGPVGPYTPMVDAARYVTALVHVARIQHGLGMLQAAGATVSAALAWRQQLTRTDLAAFLQPRVAAWALMAQSAGFLSDGDLGAANQYADAALRHARHEDFASDQLDLWVLLDLLAWQSDVRWAASLTDDALAADREALELWRSTTRAELQQLPRMTKPHLDRAATPLFALQRDLADRLDVAGQGGAADQLRDEMGDLLHKLAARRSEQGRIDLALARADQARALLVHGDPTAAAAAAEDALSALQKLLKQEQPVGQHLVTQAQVAPVLAQVELAQGRADAALRTIDGAFHRMQAHKAVEVPDAVRAVALQVRQEAARAAGQDELATQYSSEFDQLAAAIRDASPAPVDDRTLVLARARRVQLRGQEPAPYWSNLADDQALFPAGGSIAGSDEAPVLAPVQQAPVVEPVVVPTPEPVAGAEPEAVPASEPEAVPASEPEPVVVAEPPVEPEPQREVVPEPEVASASAPVAAPEPEVVRDELDVLRDAVRGAAGKDQLVAGLERLATALERRATADASLRPEAVATYERLAEAQGWWGGRGTGKHAKQLAKQWGL